MPNLPKPLARVHIVVNGSDARRNERLCCTHRLIKKGCKKTSIEKNICGAFHKLRDVFLMVLFMFKGFYKI